MSKNKTPKIDFVVTWVDGSDEEWLTEKRAFAEGHSFIEKPSSTSKRAFAENQPSTKNQPSIVGRPSLEKPRFDSSDLRFRNDFDFLKYWFRGVEKFAPWVNHIFFVTAGHLPDWLNPDHPKLKIIHHSDFIPKEFLPTFNSHTIENNLHRIAELSENFVYFNDDFYLLRKTRPEDFFQEGQHQGKTQLLPRAFFAENIIINNPSRDIFPYIQMNNMALVNQDYDKRSFYKLHKSKAYNIKYSIFNLRNFLLKPWREFSLLYDPHCAISYKKSTFETVWKKHEEILRETSLHRFRSDRDVSHLIFYYTQLLEGKFIPRSANFSHHTMLNKDENQNLQIIRMIESQKYHILCINDGEVKDPAKTRAVLTAAFDKILPEKSIFEK
jgi:capsular polysaccharide phosphotransferase wcwK